MISDLAVSALGLNAPETVAGRYPGALFLGREERNGRLIKRLRLPLPRRAVRLTDHELRLLLGETGCLANLKGRPCCEFELLYSLGFPAGVFPVPPDGARGCFGFFDFSAFQMTEAEWAGSRGGLPAEANERLAESRAAIDAYIRDWLRSRPAALLDRIGTRNILGTFPAVGVRAGFDAAGRWHAEAWPSFGEDGTPLAREQLIPVFPTVFSPAHEGNRLADSAYYEALFRELPVGPDSRVLIIGPGTGADAWVASLRTRRPVCAAGLNPLETANCRATSRLAGFKAEVRRGDVVIGPDGRNVFAGRRFDAVACNAPIVTSMSAPDSLSSLHDRDPRGELFLKPLARLLPSLLRPSGAEQALIWCRTENAGCPPVADLLRAGAREAGAELRIRSEGDLYFVGIKCGKRG